MPVAAVRLGRRLSPKPAGGAFFSSVHRGSRFHPGQMLSAGARSRVVVDVSPPKLPPCAWGDAMRQASFSNTTTARVEPPSAWAEALARDVVLECSVVPCPRCRRALRDAERAEKIQKEKAQRNEDRTKTHNRTIQNRASTKDLRRVNVRRQRPHIPVI